jgi:tetratricopeptide (TPR) repeat protein
MSLHRGGGRVQKVRLVFSLRHPDLFDWQHDDPGFNVHVHAILLDEHKRIVESTAAADHRPQAETTLLRLRAFPMSQRQQMLRYFLLAQCARAQDLTLSAHFCQALKWCGRAEQIAGALLDFGAQVDLHELRGTLHRAISIYWIAAEEFSLALRLLREHALDQESFDPEFEVTLAAKAAAMNYLLGNYDRAWEQVQRAEALLPLTTISVEGEGTVAWTCALLDRQRNEPVEALRHVETAARLYQRLGTTNSTCRVLSLAADIALDAAESLADDATEACDGYLLLAAQHVKEALRVGHAADDQVGLELAKLTLARLERVQGTVNVEQAAARIRGVLRQAGTMRDESLLTAAQTELGINLLASGGQAAGIRWLTKAVETAAHINAPGLALRAQRRLWKADRRNA